jgi:CHAT domain-containing protein/lipopolysaccharide biosynthesis regulator YciM
MARNHDDQNAVRQYLLRQLSEDEQRIIEQRLLTEDDLFEELEIAEDELIDEYLAGELSVDEHKTFEQNFLVAPERKQKLRFAKALKRQMSTAMLEEDVSKPDWLSRIIRWLRQSFFVSPVLVAATILIVAGLGIAVWRGFFYQSDVDKGLVALNAAYREQRPIEARISGFNYAPLPNTRGTEQAKVDDVSLNRAERILLDEVSEHPTPAAHHTLARLYLAERKFDKAIIQFEEALKEDPNNAHLHSDFGAALLEKGKADRLSDDSGRSFEEFAKSLEHLNKALELDSSLLEALFNRALVHEETVLPEQAKEDWRKYLEKDSKSAWADEARRHLAQLQEKSHKISQNQKDRLQSFLSTYRANDREGTWEIIRQSRDGSAFGTLIRDQLLDEYLQTSSQGETHHAADDFEALTFVGKLEFEKTGDVYTSELTRFYSMASPKQRETLTKARELMKEGRRCYAGAKPLEAIVAFDKAKRLFMGLGDSWETQYADLWIGYGYMNASDTERSLKILEPLVSSFQQQKFKWLFMRALYLLSGAEYDLSNYSKAIEHNHRALALAEEMGDAIGTFNTLHVLIEQYRYIGNYSQSLACIQRSLPLIESGALNQNQIAQYYGTVAALLDSTELYSAAADYQKESIRRALTTGQVQTISRAYANLGSIYGKMGDYRQGLESARIAYDTAKSHSDESIRKTMMVYSSRQLGDLYRQAGDFNQAIKSYDECIEINKSLDNYYGLYEAHKNRLYCYKTLGNDSAVKEELETTLALVEKYRARILEEDNRKHFFDTEQSVYDLAIDFEYSRMKNAEKAFDYAEASRSRSLLDLVNSHARISNDVNHPEILFGRLSHPLNLSDVRERIPASAQIVEYSVLNDKLVIWFISKTTFSTFGTNVRQDELDWRVRNYVQAISSTSYSPASEVNDNAKQLFEILVRPVEPLLDKNKPIYVVPDKILNYLPFGTLISPDSNRFLVQDYLTVVSPSSSLFIISSELARKKEGKNTERLLSVGNPIFDRSEFPSLSELPSAAREAEDVGSYYDSKSLLTGAAATKPRIQKEMQRSNVIHLAVHSVFDQRTPLRSKLVLTKVAATAASDGRSGGVLEASEIYRMKLPSTKVVVLSACQSGIEQYYGGEGMISLARPFLAAGVPLIVVSFWPVDSDSTAVLMQSFHRHRKQDHSSTVEALRRAQLDMLSNSDQRLRLPYCWAAFTAVGGWTSF